MTYFILWCARCTVFAATPLVALYVWQVGQVR